MHDHVVAYYHYMRNLAWEKMPTCVSARDYQHWQWVYIRCDSAYWALAR